MFSPNVDLGQVIIATFIGTTAFLVKRQIDTLDKRLDKHDEMFFKLVSDVQRLIGMYDRRGDGH